MDLKILSPQKELFSGKIQLVKVPGADGEFEIMNNHAPIVSSLSEGEIKVIDETGKPVFFAVTGGLIEVSENVATILAVTSGNESKKDDK